MMSCAKRGAKSVLRLLGSRIVVGSIRKDLVESMAEIVMASVHWRASVAWAVIES